MRTRVFVGFVVEKLGNAPILRWTMPPHVPHVHAQDSHSPARDISRNAGSIARDNVNERQ